MKAVHVNTPTKVLIPLILLIASLALPSSVAADTLHYYVSASGSDSNNGSQSSPWKTIDHAASALSLGSSGTVVHVAPGTYGCVSTTRSGGSDSQRIVYLSDTKWGAKIACNGTTGWINGNGSSVRTGDYIDIDGFQVTASSSSVMMCDGIRTFAAFNRIVNNWVHDVPAPPGPGGTGGCSGSGGQGGDGISTGNNGVPSTVGHGNLISGNIIDAIGASSLCITVHGIYISSPGNLVQNNIVSRSCGWGVHIYHYTDQEVVTNNTIINNLRGGILVSSDGSITDDNTTVSNNIVANNGGPEYGISERYGPTGGSNVYFNNLLYNNQPGNMNFSNGSRAQSGNINLTSAQFNALFVNYTGNAKTGDYHLKDGAVAIGSGTSGNCAASGLKPCIPAIDFDKATRTAMDVGAFAFGGNSDHPDVPLGLTATVH